MEKKVLGGLLRKHTQMCLFRSAWGPEDRKELLLRDAISALVISVFRLWGIGLVLTLKGIDKHDSTQDPPKAVTV